MDNKIIIILIILIKTINTEWVEISQRHYEKTKISENWLYKTTTPFYEEYANVSLKHNSWNKGTVSRVKNMATIKRVQANTIKTTQFNIRDTDDEITTEYNKIRDTTQRINTKEDTKGTKNEIKDEKNKNNKNTNDKEDQIGNVIKFLKVITDTISRNTQKSFGSKLRYLRSLQDSIMATIEDRIESTWPDDDQTSRRARSAPMLEQRGHVDFPSSESALMTLSFLTFAVYLIKLVLQLIQTYKNKTMMMTPAVFTVAKAAFKG